MPFDYKKEYKEFYLPPKTPQIVEVPAMDFLAVRGQGDPNQEGGAYKAAIGQLYAVAYTIKMSKLGKHKLEGYFDYVVPPLEGLWWMEGGGAIDFAHKERFHWISMIRLPQFVTWEAFHWAVREAEQKKGLDCSGVEFFSYEDGLCVQCMHLDSRALRGGDHPGYGALCGGTGVYPGPERTPPPPRDLPQ